MLREVPMSPRNKKGINILKVFMFICMVLIVIILLLFFVCKVRLIKVEGNTHYTKQEIIDKVITNTAEENTIFLYLKHKFIPKEEIPFIEDIEINIVNKNTVQFDVFEKSIVGCLDYMNENMYFDKDGTIVETSVEKIDNVPYIVGLKFDKIVLHEKLEITNEDLYYVLLNLTQLIRKYELTIDKISFNHNDEVTLTVDKFKVLLGKREIYDEQIAELKNLLEKTTNLKSGYLDMKNFKEGQDKIIFKEDN